MVTLNSFSMAPTERERFAGVQNKPKPQKKYGKEFMTALGTNLAANIPEEDEEKKRKKESKSTITPLMRPYTFGRD